MYPTTLPSIPIDVSDFDLVLSNLKIADFPAEKIPQICSRSMEIYNKILDKDENRNIKDITHIPLRYEVTEILECKKLYIYRKKNEAFFKKLSVVLLVLLIVLIGATIILGGVGIIPALALAILAMTSPIPILGLVCSALFVDQSFNVERLKVNAKERGVLFGESLEKLDKLMKHEEELEKVLEESYRKSYYNGKPFMFSNYTLEDISRASTELALAKRFTEKLKEKQVL
jgi:hypothetical protein